MAKLNRMCETVVRNTHASLSDENISHVDNSPLQGPIIEPDRPKTQLRPIYLRPILISTPRRRRGSSVSIVTNYSAFIYQVHTFHQHHLVNLSEYNPNFLPLR